MKRQRSSDATVVKVESVGQEVVVSSGKDTPRVKRREGGGGGGSGSGIERDFGNEEEEARRREQALPSPGIIATIDRASDGKEASSGNGKLQTLVRPSERMDEDDAETAVQSQAQSLSESESDRRKALVGTKRTNAKREEDEEAAALEVVAVSNKSLEREEGELEPEDETLEAGRTKDVDVSEAPEQEHVVDFAVEPRKEDPPASVSVDVDAEVGIPIRERSEQEDTGRPKALETTQLDLQLCVEQETKSKEVTEEGNSERVQRIVGVQGRGFPLASLNEPGAETSEQAAGGGGGSNDKFFMKLSGSGRERDREETKEGERQTEKKQRVEDGAHLSLALPDTSLSLSSGEHSRPQKQRRAHSHPSQQGPAHSRGFTDSLSLSHSLPFQHNPSCSLTQTSMDKTELSSGSQQISFGKEQASYGSWQKSHGSNQGNEVSGAHDRRKQKPNLYQKVLSNPQILQGSLGSERFRGRERGSESMDNSQGSHQVPVVERGMHTSHSDEARRALRREQKHKQRHGEAGEVWSSPSRSGDSRDTQPQSKGGRNSFGHRENEVGGSEREFTSIGVQDIVSEPIPSMARKLQELPDSFYTGLKENLRDMLNSIEKREQFVQLQQTLAARQDLTTDVLLRAHRIQLELLVAVRTGILAFLHSDIPMTHSALVEVFLQQRCRNFVCQNQLPADECDCKLCAQKGGFCNSCMCVVCSKFDFDANTCRWIGCDFCLHWCHTDCGIRMAFITPGPSIRGAAGTTEMQFHCVACGHTSELYGFVKDVFCTCAPEWGRDVLARELDCVRRIFHGSTDTRGKQLCSKAEIILQQLNTQVETSDACLSMVKFFDESSSLGVTPDQSQSSPAAPPEPKKVYPAPLNSKPPSTQTTLEMAKEALATYDSELEQKRLEASELQQERERKKAQIEELESIVRIKQAEAKMFALRADEARREAEGLHRIMLAKAEKIEQEYTGKLSKLGMEDAEDRFRKHRETVHVLQQAQRDFHAMNRPLVNELHELLKQFEASKRHSWK